MATPPCVSATPCTRRGKQVDARQADVAAGVEGAEAALEAAQEKVNEIMDAMLDVEAGAGSDDDEGSEDSDDGSGGGGDSDSDAHGCCESGDPSASGPPKLRGATSRKKTKRKEIDWTGKFDEVFGAHGGSEAEGEAEGGPHDDDEDHEGDEEAGVRAPDGVASEDEDGDDPGSSTPPANGPAAPKPLPANFSQIRPGMSAKDVETRFPEFSNAAGVSCDISAGEMLYLPAGWYHNVTSFNAPPAAAGASGSDPKQASSSHLAFNYWMHPPDTPDFERPYSSRFWEDDWEARGDIPKHERSSH